MVCIRSLTQELEAHAFFQQPNFSFEKVFKKEITPIYKPNIGGETDTANFDPQFTAEVCVPSVPICAWRHRSVVDSVSFSLLPRCVNVYMYARPYVESQLLQQRSVGPKLWSQMASRDGRFA